jgi:hypothetical protein
LIIPNSTNTFSTNAVTIQGSIYSGAPTVSVSSPNTDNDIAIQAKGSANIVMGSPTVLPQFTSLTRPTFRPAGTMIFCTDCTATDASTGVMQVYNGTTWKNAW